MNTFADQQGAPEPQREAQAPLLLHDMQSAEEAFGLQPARKRPQQAVVALLLAGGAIACIVAMRQFGLGPATSLAGIDVDYKPEAVTSGSAAKQVLAELERSRKAVQVSAEHIKSDPFVLLDAPAALTETYDSGPTDAARRAEQERLAREQQIKEIDSALSKLQLQGIMGGSVPVARISNQIVKVGMPVGEHFTLASIEGRDVTLTDTAGRSHTITFDPTASPPPRSRGNR